MSATHVEPQSGGNKNFVLNDLHGEPKRTPLHEAARRYAEAGIAVFPCRVGAKEPATPNGFHAATTDLDQIDRWWSVADYNLAAPCGEAGWAVIDIDPGADLTGLDLPDTYTVQTPRGGKHLYYEGELRGTAGKLAPHIDTRGHGGYVLLPPSVVGGKSYEVVDERDLAPLPDWIPAKLAESQRKVAANDVVGEVDSETNLARARTALRGYVKRAAEVAKREDLTDEEKTKERARYVAVSGHNGNDRTFKIACELMNLGASEEKTVELMNELWNPHCEPPWDMNGDPQVPDEPGLADIVHNAATYKQNATGSWGATDGSALRAAAEKVLAELAANSPPADETTAGDKRKFRLVLPSEAMRREPPRFWDEDKLFLQGKGGTASICYAAFSNFKTTFMAGRMLAIARKHGARVLYIVGEGADGFGPLTLQAAVKDWDESHPGDQITPDWLDAHFRLIEVAPQLLVNDELAAVKEICHEANFHPKLIVFDTLGSAAAGANLNAIEVGTAIEASLRAFCRDMKADCWLVHHEGKDPTAGATGSRYFMNDPDCALELKHDEDTHVLRVKVEKSRWSKRHRTVNFGTRTVGGLQIQGWSEPAEFVAVYELGPDDPRGKPEASERDKMAAEVRRVLEGMGSPGTRVSQADLVDRYIVQGPGEDEADFARRRENFIHNQLPRAVWDTRRKSQGGGPLLRYVEQKLGKKPQRPYTFIVPDPFD